MRILNWKRDQKVAELPLYHARGLSIFGTPLPVTTDLEPLSPPVYDQGELGSCTANAGVGVFEIKERVEGHDFGPASRLAVYFWARSLQGTQNEDSGSNTTTTMQAILDWGLPPESDWPYDIAKFTVNPPHLVYALGRQRRPARAMVARVKQDHDHIVGALAGNSAISMGFDVPQSFMGEDVAKTGLWGGPQADDPVIGGHEVVIVGHDDIAKTYKIRNSWGSSWGKGGYVTVPQRFVHSASAADFIAAIDAPK